MVESSPLIGTVLGILTNVKSSSEQPEAAVEEMLMVVTKNNQRPVVGYFPMPEETSGLGEGAKVQITVLSPEQRGSGSPYKVELARQ